MHLRASPAPIATKWTWSGLQGQTARLELSSWRVQFNGQNALLIIGVEVLPTQTVAALGSLDGAVRSRARLALESLGEAILTTDARGRIDYLNPAASNLLGVGSEAARGLQLESLAKLADESDRKLLVDPVRQALESGAPVNLGRRALVFTRSGGGGDRTVELLAAPMRSETGDNVGAVVLLHDVTEARGITRQMSYQATHDPLTGLVNRREFERRVQERMDLVGRSEGSSVLCYLDLDRFKLVNDSAGHLAGDGLLRDLAKLLRETVRDSDTVARLGGDEFGLLLPGCPLDKARQIADGLCRKVHEYRYVWKDKVFELGVSIGLVEIRQRLGQPRADDGRGRFGLLRGQAPGQSCGGVFSRGREHRRARAARSTGSRRCRARSRTSVSSSTASRSPRPSAAATTRARRWKCSCGSRAKTALPSRRGTSSAPPNSTA